MDIRTILSQLGTLAWVAIRTFVATVLVLTVSGVVLAGLSYYFLRDYGWYIGVIAAVVAIFEGVAAGLILAPKRALVVPAAHALGSMRLGRSMVGLVFERILHVAEGQELGERGGRIAKQFERLPLAQAEKLLSGAVIDLTGEAAQAGWFKRNLQARILAAVQKYTLASFREDGAKHGGVDLFKLRSEVERTIDEAILKKVRAGLRIWTALIAFGLPFVVALQTFVIILWLRSHH